MQVVTKVIKVITRIFMYIGFLAILALMLLTVYDVIIRFVFGSAMSGVVEWSQILLIICMTTMAHTLVEGRFVDVSALTDKLPRGVRFALEMIVGLVSIAFLALVGYRLIYQIESSIRFREAYFVIGVPRWPMYGVLGVSFLAAALGAIVYVFERFLMFRAPEEDKGILGDAEAAYLIEKFKDEEGSE